jgi:lysophospholipase L1-like esterase
LSDVHGRDRTVIGSTELPPGYDDGMDERVLVCFGDSNTHGSPPWTGEPAPRYGPEVRWPGVLAAALGASWQVHEEGLPGRTTVHPDPIEGGHLSGLTALPMVLGTHSPVDVLVMMLGTNDLKARFAFGPADIATAVDRLVTTARTFCVSTGRPVPRIFVVAPAPITEVGEIGEQFVGGREKSLRLGPALRATAERLGVDFLDAGAHIHTSAVDGIHLDPDAHRALGEAVAAAVR